MSSFAALKKASSLESLVEKLEKKSGGGNNSFQDDRFWKPTQDKATGLGSAVIRFLPTSPEGDAPWVQLFNHAWQDDATGKWFIEECPSTIGKECGICNFARPLWKGSDADKAEARQKGRKISYVSNILVIKDPENPENEGKLFLFKYGNQIFNKIKEMMKPTFETDVPVNPFDFWAGANFNMRISKNPGGYRTYERSFFEQPKPVYEDDDKLEELWNGQYDLKEFLAEDKFKSAEEIQQKFDNFNNAGAPAASSAANRVLEQLGQGQPAKQEPTPAAKAKVNTTPVEPKASSGGDQDSWEDLLKDL